MEKSEAHKLCVGPRTRAISEFIQSLEEMFERAADADKSDPNLELASGSRTAHTYVRKNFRSLLKAMDYTMSYGCLSKSEYDVKFKTLQKKLDFCKEKKKLAQINPALKEELKKLETEEKKLEYAVKKAKELKDKEDVKLMKKQLEDKKKGTNIHRVPSKDQLKNT